MIKNEYLSTYLSNPRHIYDIENEKFSHDDNRLLYLQRPLSERDIIKLPKKKFKKFLKDIIRNTDVNKLLYSSNAKKELLFNIKQVEFVNKATKFYYQKDPALSAKNSQNLFFRKKKAEMFEAIKKNILEAKMQKSEKKKKLEKKNLSFEKKRMKENKIKAELNLKIENEVRIEGYKRAIQTCLKKSCLNNKFKIPDISLNIKDPFSRLYKNTIIDPVNLNTKIKEIKKTETTNYNNINRKITKIKFSDYNKNFLPPSVKKKSMNRYYSFNNLGPKNKYENYHLKKVLSGYEGKEFSTEKNINDITKCIKKISGGPSIKKKLYDKLIKRTIVEKKLNNIEKKFLLNSYRDENNNSFLNIAVKKNNEKFVKYFLDKNYNPNDQNKEGNTALHLSMLRKNRKIIKLLLDKKADITIKNKEGLTSYDLADKDIRKEFKMENLLVEKQPGRYYY